jgi:hypothetical protein
MPPPRAIERSGPEYLLVGLSPEIFALPLVLYSGFVTDLSSLAKPGDGRQVPFFS